MSMMTSEKLLEMIEDKNISDYEKNHAIRMHLLGAYEFTPHPSTGMVKTYMAGNQFIAIGSIPDYVNSVDDAYNMAVERIGVKATSVLSYVLTTAIIKANKKRSEELLKELPYLMCLAAIAANPCESFSQKMKSLCN